MEDSALFIAIDFGTAFSGYTFCFKGSEQKRQIKWGVEHGYDTAKTPTCILFDEDENFLEFGYDAIIKYTRHTQTHEAKKLYLFDNFKMELYNKELNRELKIKAKNGKEMTAMKVFSESLKFMKGHALKNISAHTGGREYTASDATWILTVPAIWSAAAKQFMREAATEAGLVTESDPESLFIALEPEAASIYCKQLPSEGFLDAALNAEDKIEDVPGTRYMVVDCGGGTIDITVHEVLNGGHLKELHKVSGNGMGGQTVDKNFKSFLREIFSNEVFEEFEENHPSELQKLMYEFSTCKRFDHNVLVPCQNNLQMIAGKKKNMEEYFEEISDAGWDSGSILLSKEKLKDLHDDSLRAIESLIEEILRESNLKIQYLFLVGGFGLSPHVRDLVRQKFQSKCKVLCPVDAQVAVLKGAVEFGMMPRVVKSRISLFSYGVSTCEKFNKSIHKGKSQCTDDDGEVFCDVCFCCLVKRGESVSSDEVRKFTFYPVNRDQTAMSFSFYCTEDNTAKFVDEEGMKEIGSLLVNMPDITKGKDRKVSLEIKFGFTEMKATARDIVTDQTSTVKLDFLTTNPMQKYTAVVSSPRSKD